MPDVESTVRAYAAAVLERVEPVSAEQILARGPGRQAQLRPRLAMRPLALAAVSALVVASLTAVLQVRRPAEVALGVSPVPATAMAGWGAPLQVESGNGFLWVAFSAAGERGEGPGGIARADPRTLVVTPWAEVDGLISAAFAGDALWVASFATDTVTKLDALSGEVLAEVVLPTAPGFQPYGGGFFPNAIAATARDVWVTTARGFVAQLDVGTGDVSAIHQLTPDAPGSVIADDAGAWVAEAQAGVTAITSDGQVTARPITVDGQVLVVQDVALGMGRVFAVGTVLAQPQRFSDGDSGALVVLEGGVATPVARTQDPLDGLVVHGDSVIGWSSETGDAALLAEANAGAGDVDAVSEVLSWTGVADAASESGALWLLDSEADTLTRFEDDGAETVIRLRPSTVPRPSATTPISPSTPVPASASPPDGPPAEAGSYAEARLPDGRRASVSLVMAAQLPVGEHVTGTLYGGDVALDVPADYTFSRWDGTGWQALPPSTTLNPSLPTTIIPGSVVSIAAGSGSDDGIRQPLEPVWYQTTWTVTAEGQPLTVADVTRLVPLADDLQDLANGDFGSYQLGWRGNQFGYPVEWEIDDGACPDLSGEPLRFIPPGQPETCELATPDAGMLAIQAQYWPRDGAGEIRQYAHQAAEVTAGTDGANTYRFNDVGLVLRLRYESDPALVQAILDSVDTDGPHPVTEGT